MDHRVIYLMSGPSYLPYLVCSLKTLRQHWTGMVEVHAWPESFELTKRVALDDRLQIEVIQREPVDVGSRRKKWQFVDKIRLCRESSARAVLYLDADTTVHGAVDYLFAMAASYSFVATQFNDWCSNRTTIRKRVERLKGHGIADDREIDSIVTGEVPSPNGGVFACRPESSILREWENTTLQVMDIFIPDETALHLMLRRHYGGGSMTLASGGRWNCSPKYQPKGLRDEDVVIRHYHGHSNVRPNKSQRGVDLWWPIFEHCLVVNIGGMAEWIDGIENKYLNRLLEEERK